MPVIADLNSTTSPSSPVGLPIEIIGTGFQGAPGQVIFSQGSITATVTPSSGGWSSTGIVAVVPSGNGTTPFTVPGTVSVAVKTTGGTSNVENLSLVQTFTFNVNNITWTTATPLPKPMSGMRAVAVPGGSSSSAFVVVTGGYNGSGNVSTVLTNSLSSDKTLGTTWTTSAYSLPFARADHAMVEADPGNSLVPVGSRFIYVIGGQQGATDTPGGTNTVYMAQVDPATGALVGSWTTLASTLPHALVGPGATVYNGYIYVVGGLQTSGIPSSAVYSAPINSTGTLGSWSTSANPYPVPVAFPTVLGFAGNLYVINGDSQNETSPNVADLGGITDVRYAPASLGIVGNWTRTSPTIKNRSKQITWLEFGQIIDSEGTYNGGATGSTELERTTVNPDSTLAAWSGVTAVNAPNANVYNATAIVSPVLSLTNAPRFLLFGGQQYKASGTNSTITNPLSATVYVNNNTTP